MFYGISYKDIISEAKSYFINGYMAILLLHYSMMSFILKWGCGEIKQVLSSYECSPEGVVYYKSYFKVYTIVLGTIK